MEDYREKIGQLPKEKLVKLILAYQKTIKQLEATYKEATMVAMLSIADYSETELTKKKTELAEIENILARLTAAPKEKSGD